MTKYIALSLALVVALLVAVSPSVPNAMARSANVPPGIYTTTLTAADIPASFPPEYIPVLVGDWEVELSESGSYIVSKDGYPGVVGRYKLESGSDSHERICKARYRARTSLALRPRLTAGRLRVMS